MAAKYQLKPKLYLLNDQDGAARHILQDDYFGSIATILNLWRQQVEKNPETLGPDFYKTIIEIENDLIWLQQKYQIKPKIKKKNIIPKGRETNQ